MPGLVLAMLAQWASAAVSVVDDAGRQVVLDEPARRIVSLAPHATELVFAAGAGDLLVGVAEHSDYPPQARRLPRVGGGAGLDIERILALRPDLVVAWQSGNGVARLQRLEQLGLTLFYSEPRRIEAIATSLERLGRLAGTANVAGRAADRFRRRVRALRERYANRSPVRVFYQIWARPLMTVNGEHMISAWLSLCGGENIFAGLDELAPTVGVEAVIAADPDAIIAGRWAGNGAGKGSGWQAHWRRWTQLKAVRLGHLLTVPAGAMERQTPRAVEAARELCEKLDRVRSHL